MDANLSGSQGTQIGDHNQQTNYFNMLIDMRETGRRVDAASLMNFKPHQIVELVRAMSHHDGGLMLVEAEADAAVVVLDALLQMDEALAVSLLDELSRGNAEKLAAAVTAEAPGREWLRQLPEAAEAIAERGTELQWTSPGRLERAGYYQRASSSGRLGHGNRKRPPKPPAPVYRRAYENGCVYWCRESGGSGARALAGVILDHYVSSGECRGQFGIPVGEETPVTFAAGDRWVQRFSSGAIYRHESSVIAVERAVAEYLHDARGGVDRFYPLHQKAAAATSPYGARHGWQQRFQGPVSASGETVYYIEKAHGVSGEIASYYELQGGAGAWLGYPTSNAIYRGTRVTQDFEGGTVFAGIPETKAVAVPVASMALIRDESTQERLGFPVAAEERVGHGDDTWQFFENGVVTSRNKKRELWVRPDQA